MQLKATASPSSSSSPGTPERLAPKGGVLVLHGYGVRVAVERGTLAVSDGIGTARRAGTFTRATSGIRRLVVIGHTGSITFEALRWLNDIGAAFVQIDADGTVIGAWGPPGLDDAGLRRAQARAGGTPAGMAIARDLIREKLHGQRDVLDKLSDSSQRDEAAAALARCLAELETVETAAHMLRVEAAAAAAYWAAWASVPVRFARKDARRVPEHWQTFGVRTSPLTASPRKAANPANAILNYLYAILETEARIAALAVGLDPGMGFLHADQKSRDSLACDLMEAVRPKVDAYLLSVLTSHIFRVSDFIETREGVCRVSSDITGMLAETAPMWTQAVGSVAERVAQALVTGEGKGTGKRLPTPLTQANRSAGRDGVRRTPARPAVQPSDQAQLFHACPDCGTVIEDSGRRYCDACLPDAKERSIAVYAEAGPAALARLMTEGRDPSHGGDAGRKRGAAIAARLRDAAKWNAEHDGKPDPDTFRREILPALQGISLSRIMQATGLSLRYCSLIRRGERVPNARYWDALRQVASG